MKFACLKLYKSNIYNALDSDRQQRWPIGILHTPLWKLRIKTVGLSFIHGTDFILLVLILEKFFPFSVSYESL